MSKLVVFFGVLVIIVGIAAYIFTSDDGINQEVIEGHTRMQETLRGFDYSTD